MQRKYKQKKCKACPMIFQPTRPLQAVCSPVCALVHTRTLGIKKAEKAARARTVADRERLKTLGDHHKDTQAIFNRFIRERDKKLGRPCISCQRHDKGQYHAGHYKEVGMGGASPLRYNEDNCHLQCSQCNEKLSGNLILYRINLVKLIGLDRVEYLEGPQEVRQYRIDDLKELQKVYKAKIKELKEDGHE
jgi:hypothetical protein